MLSAPKPRPVFHLGATASVVAVCLFAVALLTPLVAEDDAGLRMYDLPAGNANESLKLFSHQSGRGVIAGDLTVAGVTTNVVKGEMTAREAVDQMLAATGLIATLDEKTGAFAIRRALTGKAENDEGDRASPAKPDNQTSDPQKKKIMTKYPPEQEPMKKPNLRARIATTFAVLLSSSSYAADSIQGSSPEPAVVELSPFVVSSDQDTGYQATNTLAGTRLNTPIQDIGASISVYTKDFLEDISSTDFNEMLIYATGMEASGAQGNISGLTANPGNNSTGTTREDPEGGAGFGVAIRTRGLSVPTRTRGFFVTDIPSDTYNADRVTVNRGPNSILFGAGNPGGIIDSSLVSANLSRNMNKIQLRYGDNDSHRASVDFNRVLLRDKLAVRIAALYSREEYDQRPAFEERRRLYGTLTYRPFKSTSIRTNFESGKGNANRVFTVPPSINYAAWQAAGGAPFDWTFYDDPARNPSAAAQNVQNFVPLEQNPTFFGDRVIAVFADPTGAVPMTGFSNRVRLHVLPANVFHPVFNRDSAADNFQFVDTRNISGLPNAWWPDGQAPAGLRSQTYTDYSAFDWRKRQLVDSERQTHSFNTFNIAVEQRGWSDRVGIELAYDRQRFTARQQMGGEPSGVSIDTNVTLPTGEPNPNLGRPYMVAQGIALRSSENEREGMRATAFLKYDFNDVNESWGKWLGTHIVTGLVEHNALEKLRGDTRFQVDGPAALQASADVLNGNRQYRAIYYIGPSIFENNNQVRLEPIRAPFPQNGDSFMTTYYDPATGSLVTAPTTLVEYRQNSSPGAVRDVLKSLAFSMQSYWLQDHLVTLAGWRRDRDYFQQYNLLTVRNETRTGPNDPGQVHFRLDEFDFDSTPDYLDGADIVSYSAVLKWPKRFLDLPGGSDLSVFYNRSDNFAPTGGRIGTFGEPLTSPTGETEEYGINFSAFEGKLSIRLNRFDTRVVNQTIVRGGLPAAISESGVVDTVSAWTREGNRNLGNVAFMNAAINQLLSPLPGDYLQYRNFSVSGTAPDITTTFDRPIPSDTTDFSARGTEVGIVYNPTRNWRIMANITKAETIQTNIYPLTRAMLDLLAPAINSTITDPSSGVQVSFRDIPKNGYPEGFGPANPPGANIQTFGEWLDNNIVFPLANARAAEGQVSPEQRKWRVNLVTNYTFGSRSLFGDRLKGWGVGAGYRWQSKIALGYPSSIDDDGVAQFDIANPYWGPAETNVDAWVSYSRRIWNDRINWKLQLNVKNLFGGNGLIAVRSQPWGEHAAVRIPPEKRWYLTSTFEF